MGVPFAAASLAVILTASAVTTVNLTLPVRHPASRVVTICLAPDGRTVQGNATCSLDKLHNRLGACTCPGNTLVAETDICWPGQHAVADSAAANRARYEAAVNGHGSLRGASFQGRSFCQHVKDDGYPHWTTPVEGAPMIHHGN
ncbi:MAG TPA: hypothetical protein VGL66_11140 [Caulobacteraceae bacterium]|jgi:hypothetical protein